MEHRLEFTESENPWAPTAVVAEINERTGCGLELVGLSEQTGGTSSAAYVRWPDGRECALTRTKTPLALMRTTAEIVTKLRTRGLPVPRHDLVMELSDGRIAVVQERLPGKHLNRIDAGTIDAMVAMNDRFAGLLADRTDVPVPPAFPTSGASDNPWEQTLGCHSDRTRRLLGRIREIDAGKPYEMSGNDVVHTDYSLGNILFDEHGQITGVVDWNFGIARGDRRFALLGMRLNLRYEGAGYRGRRPATERLDEILATTIDPDLLRIYWAHRAVHGVHWSLYNRFRPDRIERDLSYAEELLG